MTDRFSSNALSLTGPAAHGFGITPSDSLDLTEVTRAIYVGGTGTLAVRMLSGQVLTLSAVAAGSLLPLRIDRVMQTGTTATAIVGLV